MSELDEERKRLLEAAPRMRNLLNHLLWFQFDHTRDWNDENWQGWLRDVRACLDEIEGRSSGYIYPAGV